MRKVRAATVHARSFSREDIELGYKLWPKQSHGRPLHRSQCQQAARPCPFVSCRYHLYLDVSRQGSIKFNFPDLEVWELPNSCALDVADRGPTSLETIADLMNLTRQGAQVIESRGKAAMASRDSVLTQML